MKINKSPTYLIRNPYGYCFRMRVPPDLQPIINKKEIRYSLKTGNIVRAKHKACLIGGRVLQLFNYLSRKEHTMAELSPDQIHKLVLTFVRQALNDHESYRLESKPLTPDKLNEQVNALEYVYTDIKEDLALCKHHKSSNMVDRLLSDNNIKLDPDSESYKRLCRELMIAQVQILEAERKRILGDYSEGPHLISQPQANFPQEQSETSEPVSKIIQGYWNENINAGNWSERSKGEYKTCLEALEWLLQRDVQIHTITFETMRKIKETLQGLPKNFKNKTEYRGKSPSEIIKMVTPETPRLSTSTINKYLGVYGGLFNYAVRNNYIKNSPASGLQIKQKKRPDEHRDTFDKSDLIKIFNPKNYQHKQPYQYWLPLLGLYTGCRIEELCQLYSEDIQKEGDIWIIDINSNNDKKLKTEGSRRKVPIHPTLIKLGFIEFAQANSDRIFPELKMIKHRYSHYPSRWFGEYKLKCGVASKKKTFHSFRHTLIDNLKQKQVTDYIIAELVGHTIESMTMSRYGKTYSPELLYREAILKLDYGVDIMKMK
jgi:integrase